MVTTAPRERVVYAAVQGLRRGGAVGTSLRTLVAQADAPWGSLKHYFPRGKEQLIAEALVWAGDFAGDRVRKYLETAPEPTPPGLFADLIGTWAADMARNGFELGCPVVGAVADGPDENEEVHAACATAMRAWIAPIDQGFQSMGVTPAVAEDLALTIIACAEGAILMARVTRSAEPLLTVQRSLTPLLEHVAHDD